MASIPTRRVRTPRVPTLAALLALPLVLAACMPPSSLPLPGLSSLFEEPISCPPLIEPASEARLYFGLARGRGGGPITEEEWQAFLDEVVTPRFPDGLTVLDAYGQWRAGEGAPIEREHTKVLVIVVDSLSERLPDLRAVAGTYKARFRQQSVLLTAKPVCAAF